MAMKTNKKVSYECYTCKANFQGRQEMIRHFRLSHKRKKSPKGSFPCVICEKILSTKESLRNHKINIHEKEIKFFK